MMASRLPDAQERVCSCGHPVSAHRSEIETARFIGLFNPALAGRAEEYVWMQCDGDETEPCGAGEHSW